MFYYIHYKCPDCGGGERDNNAIQLDAPNYDGSPLTDFYDADAMNKTIATTKHVCKGATQPNTAKAEGFYVEVVDWGQH